MFFARLVQHVTPFTQFLPNRSPSFTTAVVVSERAQRGLGVTNVLWRPCDHRQRDWAAGADPLPLHTALVHQCQMVRVEHIEAGVVFGAQHSLREKFDLKIILGKVRSRTKELGKFYYVTDGIDLADVGAMLLCLPLTHIPFPGIIVAHHPRHQFAAKETRSEYESALIFFIIFFYQILQFFTIFYQISQFFTIFYQISQFSSFFFTKF